MTNPTEPGSPEWELELCRQEFNHAGVRVHEARRRLDEVTQELVRAAECLGRAQAAVEKG